MFYYVSFCNFPSFIYLFICAACKLITNLISIQKSRVIKNDFCLVECFLTIEMLTLYINKNINFISFLTMRMARTFFQLNMKMKEMKHVSMYFQFLCINFFFTIFTLLVLLLSAAKISGDIYFMDDTHNHLKMCPCFFQSYLTQNIGF